MNQDLIGDRFISTPHLKYRPDIDGLRAVAIILVVLFHAFPSQFPSGFIGVDIFFVISGYLITTLIYRDIQNEKFNFLDFYARRFKRLLPALVIVLLFIWAIGWKILLADEYFSLGKHLIGGSTFTSNIVLWLEAGYFDKASELKPLLHLWSLGVEEQFYLIWPLLLVFICKNETHLLKAVFLIFIASLVLQNYLWSSHSIEAFYLLPTRLWEPGLGAILAIAESKNTQILDRITGNRKGMIGCALILAGVILISMKTSYPIGLLLFPTLGTFTIIAAGGDGFLNKTALSSKPLVYIGRISYPLYLWHWPLLAFANIVEEENPSLSIRIAVIFISFLLAILTWKFVETPIQKYASTKMQSKMKNINIIIFGICTLSLIAIIGFVTIENDGFRNRNGAVENLNDLTDLNLSEFDECLKNFGLTGKDVHCYRSPGGQVPKVLIIGDSHAIHLIPGLNQHLSLIQIGKNNCPPLLGIEVMGPGQQCIEMYNQLIHLLDHSLKEVKVAIIAFRMPLILNSNSEEEKFHSRMDFKRGLLKMVQSLHALGKTVVLFIDIPELKFSPRACVNLRPFRFHAEHKQECVTATKSVIEYQAQYRQIINEVVKESPDTQVYDPIPHLCDDRSCYAVKDGKLLYRDRDHLNNQGSAYIADDLSQFLNHLMPETN